MEKLKNIKAIAFDADDTLWASKAIALISLNLSIFMFVMFYTLLNIGVLTAKITTFFQKNRRKIVFNKNVTSV